MTPTPSKDVCFENGFNGNQSVQKRVFPYQITKVDFEINKQLLKDFTGERTGFVQVGPQKWLFPSSYETEAKNYYNFEVRPDDVWVITYPRSGTTWTQEMVWLLANNFDYQTASDISLTERFPFLEFSMFMHPQTKAEFFKECGECEIREAMLESVAAPGWKILKEQTGRRFIKTHLPFSLLPPELLTAGCKVIYVARNPKDVAVSYYHLNRLIRTQGYVGDFPKFWDYFEKDLLAWSPYWAHIQQGWEQRNSKNVLFMFYEHMNKVNLREGIEIVASFLDKTVTEPELDKLENHLKIDNFRENNSVNFDILKFLGILNSGEQGFVRKGQNGGWQEDFPPELNERADKWIEENLKHTDLKFPL